MFQYTPTYVDFAIQFLPDPSTGDIVLVEDADSVKQGVQDIVLTNFYERFHHPYVGSNIVANLFDNLDPISASIIQNNILVAQRNYCPYANVLSVQVVQNDDQNMLEAIITFGIINLMDPITVSVFLRRLR